MRHIRDLKLGFNDAENYRRKDEKDFFNRIFLRDDALDKTCQESTFFLCGEKGTGKTAYAVFLANNDYKNTVSRLVYIRETDYKKFVDMRRNQHLALSDYTDVWKVIIYLLLAEKLASDDQQGELLSRFSRFRQLRSAIDEYYSSAFTPEIVYAFNFAENSEATAALLARFMNEGSQHPRQNAMSRPTQINLLYIQKKFEQALASLELRRSHILFIDGIDIRPSGVSHEQYLECVKGLANAVWSVNSDFLPNIKGSKGRLKVVLLIRPDIFNSLGLQNQNNKIRDNSVLLDWRTTYKEHRTSNIFRLVDKLLASQQGTQPLASGSAWEYYFPFRMLNMRTKKYDDPAFIPLLRLSFYRPRDIVSMLNILQANVTNEGRPSDAVFKAEDLEAAAFKRPYAEYLLGEVKDQFAFYYTEAEYDLFLRFFTYLKGRNRFTYDAFLVAYASFTQFLQANRLPAPSFLESADQFLQFLFELNLVSYIEPTGDGDDMMRWCFRERSYANISPKVLPHLTYSIHQGLLRSIRVGHDPIVPGARRGSA
jgi:adenylate kinase family enzyme